MLGSFLGSQIPVAGFKSGVQQMGLPRGCLQFPRHWFWVPAIPTLHSSRVSHKCEYLMASVEAGQPSLSSSST